ncbi:MAG: sigma-70 family RNA polymerase sigma factor [Marinicaulis sp.]|nr:sigma-70 family RNA polymerase sigma factor [Marinicaulis sp.]
MRRQKARILDEYLAASARAGDRVAFGQLAKRWQPKLYAHACRLMGDAELARDVVQEGWGDIAKGLSRLDDAAVFPAWAYRIITRRAADSIRRTQRDRRLTQGFVAEPTPEDNGAAAIEVHADRTPLTKAMASLPPEQRAAIALFYLEDFSVAEIAAALSVPAGTVKTRLMHARRKLRTALEGGMENG